MASGFFTEFEERSATKAGQKAPALGKQTGPHRAGAQTFRGWPKVPGKSRRVHPKLGKRIKTHAVEEF